MPVLDGSWATETVGDIARLKLAPSRFVVTLGDALQNVGEFGLLAAVLADDAALGKRAVVKSFFDVVVPEHLTSILGDYPEPAASITLRATSPLFRGHLDSIPFGTDRVVACCEARRDDLIQCFPRKWLPTHAQFIAACARLLEGQRKVVMARSSGGRLWRLIRACDN